MGWVTKAPMPTARVYLAAGVVNGILYAVGGDPEAARSVNQAYNPSTNTWANRASMTTARYGLAAGGVGNYLYAVGGYTGSARLAVNERYDPSTNTWSSRATMPTARSSLAVGVINGVLYAVGGYDGSARLAVNESYNPSTNTWSSQASMPTARDSLAAGVVNGILYAVGGYDAGSILAVNESYNPSTNTWASRANMPTARERLAAGVINDVLYAVGGYTGSLTAVNEAYTPDGTVTGTVRDAATLQPLAGVSVTSDDGQATTTGPDGTYTLAEVAVGTRQITYQKDQYLPTVETVSVSAGSTVTKNVDLVRDAIIVTVSRPLPFAVRSLVNVSRESLFDVNAYMLHGLIRDKTTLQPIPGATITLTWIDDE